MKITVTSRMEAPARAVWAVLSDYRLDPSWRAGVATMDPVPPGPSQVGTTTTEVMRFLGSTMENRGEVVDVVPGERVAWRARGDKVAVSGHRSVRPCGAAAAEVTLELEGEMSGVPRWLEPVLAAVTRRRMRADLRRLGALLASRSRGDVDVAELVEAPAL